MDEPNERDEPNAEAGCVKKPKETLIIELLGNDPAAKVILRRSSVDEPLS